MGARLIDGRACARTLKRDLRAHLAKLLHNTVTAGRFLAGHEVTGTHPLSPTGNRTLVEAS